ncbi:LysR family transcriptional regulator [Streptomyces sp. NPDC059618]|uniref:LysR family transcriptional regulator n=1 Tax=Streptomyces sp. NPDC059618 TaxID=3346887 RepID=UPI0036BF2BAB
MDVTVVGLRVLRVVAERGTFTGAARELGYTQSAVSRQVAGLEQAVDARLFDRSPGGVRLTAAGRALLRHAVTALDALDAADRELRGADDDSGGVRLGHFPAAGPVLVARALATLGRERPRVRLATREGTTPSLVRALRAGTLDVALLSSRPPHRSPDTDDPALHVEPLLEDRLVLAVRADGPLADRAAVMAQELADVTWIAGPSGTGDPLLGVWPGLPGRPRVHHAARDWLTKLHLVAAGAGVTTVPATLRSVTPPGIRLVTVTGLPEERRRVSLVRLPGPTTPPVDAVLHALRGHAAELAD